MKEKLLNLTYLSNTGVVCCFTEQDESSEKQRDMLFSNPAPLSHPTTSHIAPTASASDGSSSFDLLLGSETATVDEAEGTTNIRAQSEEPNLLVLENLTDPAHDRNSIHPKCTLPERRSHVSSYCFVHGKFGSV